MSINREILLTLLILIFTIILFGVTNIDIFVQDYFFDTDKNSWILDRNLEPWKSIFYVGIKKVLILFALSLLISLLFFRKYRVIQEYKKGILIVISSFILIPAILATLKKVTNMPCPKNEIHYGGKMVRTAVWESYPEKYKNMKRIACWPAGHASGGFALLSLFFLFKSRKNKIIVLITALIIGWSMGIYKMAIGDHFLSHTLITMILAWLIILIIVKIVGSRE